MTDKTLTESQIVELARVGGVMSNYAPDCCLNCKHYEWDTPDDGYTIWQYCTIGVKMPVTKLTCKRQQPLWPINKDKEEMK